MSQRTKKKKCRAIYNNFIRCERPMGHAGDHIRYDNVYQIRKRWKNRRKRPYLPLSNLKEAR